MSKENSRERIIQLAFGAYPEVKEFHFTSDNQAFSEESDAKNHASTLKDKEVELIKRSSLKKNTQEADASSAADAGNDDKKTAKDVVDLERDALVERYTELLGKSPNHNTGVKKLKAEIEKAEAALKEKESKEPIKKILTQEDLDANPELVAQGAGVGDEIEIPGE